MCHVGYHNGVKCSKSTNGVVGRNMVIREGTSTPYPYPEWVSFSIRISHCPLLDGDGHFSPLYEASPDARLRQLYLIEISLVLPGLAKKSPMKHRLGFLSMRYNAERLSNLEKLETLGYETACWNRTIFFIQFKKPWQFPFPSRQKQSDQFWIESQQRAF